MQSFTTKKGSTVYVSYMEDCDENEGGYYCEVELDVGEEDDALLVYMDNFVIHKEEIEGYEGVALWERLAELTECWLQDVEY